MTTGACIAFVAFGFGVGLFALLFLHSEDDSSNKKLAKHKHIVRDILPTLKREAS